MLTWFDFVTYTVSFYFFQGVWGKEFRNKLRFQISGNCSLVKQNDILNGFFNNLPVKRVGQHWEIQVQPGTLSQIGDIDAVAATLTNDGKYTLHLGTTKWTSEKLGTGLSLQIISAVEIM